MTTTRQPERPAHEPLSVQLARCMAEIDRRSQVMADTIVYGFRSSDRGPDAA